MSDEVTPVSVLMGEIRRFAEVRGWEPYHSPKNLVMALASEVGELCDLFRWLTPEESREIIRDPARRTAVADEIADGDKKVVLIRFDFLNQFLPFFKATMDIAKNNCSVHIKLRYKNCYSISGNSF